MTDQRQLDYLAGCLAKMERTGPCSRDFLHDCTEPHTPEHVEWAREILDTLEHLQPATDLQLRVGGLVSIVAGAANSRISGRGAE